MNIETVLQELYAVSGCRVSIHDTKYEEIAAYPHEKSPFCALIHVCRSAYEDCVRGDEEALSRVRETEQPYIYRCRFGLYEAVAPLYHAGVLTGYLMMGQIADSGRNAREDIFTASRSLCDKTTFTEAELYGAIAALNRTDEARFRSFVSIMTICAEYITLTGRLNMPPRDLAHMVKVYIEQHYAEKITLDGLCTNFRCSKSTLMNAFREAYGTTVGAALEDARLRAAARLLSETDNQIRDVASACGYTDQGYFTKVFTRVAGYSPTAFRRLGGGALPRRDRGPGGAK